MKELEFFEILPGEMKYEDPPEAAEEPLLNITQEEVQLIQQFARGAFVNDAQADEKAAFLQRMYDRCPFVTPSSTLH
jgi:hypothetical protein